MRTAASRSVLPLRLRWIAVQLSAAASGTASAIAVPARWRGLIAASSCAYIQPMPMPAARIAPQVRPGSRWPSATRANSAVTSGARAIVTSTLATVVIVIATMNAVNMTAQHRPESQSVGSRLASVFFSAMAPRRRTSRTTSATALKKLRQNVASTPLAESSWRVTTPAMLQSSVATTIATTARAWVSAQ